MYAEIGVLFPYYQSFSQESQHFHGSYQSHNTDALLTTISEYDLGGEGDLFKAPEPIIEEPVVDLDPMTVAISMISCGEDAITSPGLKIADIDLINSEQLLSEVFYECKKDILAKEAIESPLLEVLDIKILAASTDESQTIESKSPIDVTVNKTVSLGCLMPVKPMEITGMDFGAVYGMRRAFSEGDIKALGNGNVNVINSPVQQPSHIGHCSTEERREKLSRYRNKKAKRNFGRKIKYACRKVLADNQPRIRGRFAKTEESDA